MSKLNGNSTRRLILFFSGTINSRMIAPLKQKAQKLDVELILGAESLGHFN